MKYNSGIFASIGLAFLSFPFVAYGSYLREHSTQFNNWFNSFAHNSDIDPGMGAALATWWVFISLFWIIGLFLYSISLLLYNLLYFLLQKTKRIIVLLKWLFSAIYLWFALMIINDALINFMRGFILMSLGEFLTVTALILGVIFIMRKGDNIVVSGIGKTNITQME